MARHPPLDKAEYHRWAIDYRGKKALKLIEADPKSNRQVADLLKSTKYDNRISVSELSCEINRLPGFDRLPLGNYSLKDGKVFCYLDLQDILLPQDIPRCGPNGLWDGTHLKCRPDNPQLPKFFHQIGQLCLSKTRDARRAQPSDFVVVVTPCRKVYAIWNPLGPDPEYTYDDNGITSTAHINRPVSGKLMGFDTPCTAIKLAEAIDSLCELDREGVSLDISQGGFITADPRSTLQFTGIHVP